jgi:DNA repair exonuclease SbcCD ATPase subunit
VKKWEYKTIRLKEFEELATALDEAINQLGAKSWRVVAVNLTQGQECALMEREISESAGDESSLEERIQRLKEQNQGLHQQLTRLLRDALQEDQSSSVPPLPNPFDVPLPGDEFQLTPLPE